MSEIFNVLMLLIIAGIAMPFLWQLIKRILKIRDQLALVCTIALQVILAVAVLAYSGMLTIWYVVPAWLIVFLVAQKVYEKIIVKLWREA